MNTNVKNIILSGISIVLLSGCSYKAELVSQTDSSVHHGKLEDFFETFEFTIRDETFKGEYTINRSMASGMGYIDGKQVFTSSIAETGGTIKQRGSNGGFLSCFFSVNNSTDHGECVERKSNERFDLIIR